MPQVTTAVRADQGLKALVAKSKQMTKSYKGGEAGKSNASFNMGPNKVLANLSQTTRFEFTELQTQSTATKTKCFHPNTDHDAHPSYRPA